MKRIAALVLILGLLLAVTAAYAEDRAPTPIIDLSTIDPVLDPSLFDLINPCGAADLVLYFASGARWTNIASGTYVVSTTDYLHRLGWIPLSLTKGGEVIGRIISEYTRIKDGDVYYVNIKDAFNFASVLLWGQAGKSNKGAGYSGASGAMSKITAAGSIVDLEVRYVYTDQGGDSRVCLFWD